MRQSWFLWAAWALGLSTPATADVLVVETAAATPKRITCVITEETETGYKVKLRVGGKIGEATFSHTRVQEVERQSAEENALLLEQWGAGPAQSKVQRYPIPESRRRFRKFSPRKLREFADAGDAEAEYQLGLRHEEGDGTEKHYPRAAQWYERAAKQGHTDAQYRLGWLNLTASAMHWVVGNDDDLSWEWVGDRGIAYAWFTKAGNAGHPKAQNFLGHHFSKSNSGQQDDAEAFKWYVLGGPRHVEDHMHFKIAADRKAFMNDVSDANRAEGQRRADAWQDAHRKAMEAAATAD